MTSKNFNRVLTVVVNKLNKCYFNFTKPENMKSVTIEKSTFLVEHELGLEIDVSDMFLYINVDGARVYEIDLDNEVKDSNELFNRVQYLLALAYGGVYNGDYDELVESEENSEVGEATETTETEDFEGLDKIETSEQETIETNEIKGHIYIDTDSVIIAPLPEKKVSESYRKHLHAIMNPEWHHVSLATLKNIDIDMLDEKRQTYLIAYRDLKQTLSYLRKCKTQDTYDTCFIRYTRRKNMLWAEGEISDAMWKYIERKLSMQNVESGVWASKCEDATGHHESRRYNKSRA